MSRLPKLKVKLPASYLGEEVFELEEAKDILNFDEGIIMVEGQTVHSYDDFVQLITQQKYKNLEFIEIVVLPIIVGG
jgi:PDZ domain-containing secreted protein